MQADLLNQILQPSFPHDAAISGNSAKELAQQSALAFKQEILTLLENGTLQIPAQDQIQLKNFLSNYSLLEGIKITINGTGSMGLAAAMFLSAFGAVVKLRSDSTKPCAMTRAIGILEPQGADVEQYWINSLPILEFLIKNGAPLRWELVEYLYRDGSGPSQGFLEELERMPNSNYSFTDANVPGFSKSLKFNGILVHGLGLREYYIAELHARGVIFEEATFQEIIPDQDSAITITALGLGRGMFRNSVDNNFSVVDIPGNRGQVILMDGLYLEGQGVIGAPSPKGSVNVVQHFLDPVNKKGPFVLIGATKKVGSSDTTPDSKDHDFLVKGVRDICPKLYEDLIKNGLETLSGSSEASYVCIRPGGGTTPFSVGWDNGCIDVKAPGGMGNSLAPATALQIAAMIVDRQSANKMH